MTPSSHLVSLPQEVYLQGAVYGGLDQCMRQYPAQRLPPGGSRLVIMFKHSIKMKNNHNYHIEDFWWVGTDGSGHLQLYSCPNHPLVLHRPRVPKSKKYLRMKWDSKPSTKTIRLTSFSKFGPTGTFPHPTVKKTSLYFLLEKSLPNITTMFNLSLIFKPIAWIRR